MSDTVALTYLASLYLVALTIMVWCVSLWWERKDKEQGNE